MKNTYIKKKIPFSVRFNEEEFKILKTLKEEYAINISDSFKMFLKRYLRVLKENDAKI